MSGGPFLYPNVGTPNPATTVGPQERKNPESQARPGEFGKIFDQAVGETGKAKGESLVASQPGALGQIKTGLRFSAHANQRMLERKIALDAPTMAKVNDAVDRAAAKGVEDTLVLTNGAALIVNVPNRTVVTAMERGAMEGNVFTNIDGAVIV